MGFSVTSKMPRVSKRRLASLEEVLSPDSMASLSYALLTIGLDFLDDANKLLEKLNPHRETACVVTHRL